MNTISLQKNIPMPHKKLIILSGIILIINFKTDCQNLYDYSNSLKYANYLFQSKQYNYSVIEYERLIFLAPHDTLAKLRLVQSYRFLKDYKNAENWLEIFFPVNKQNVPDDFANEFVKVYLYDHQYKNAFNFLQINNNVIPIKKVEYQVGSLLLECKWNDAKLFADEQAKRIQKSSAFNQLYAIAQKGMAIKYKKPACAAVMSAIIPGSGKLYTRHWKDAIYSFLFVGATSWMAYYSYHNNGLTFSSVLLGTVAGSFYAANIYGSYKSADRYNQKLNDAYKKEVENIILKE
jgi:hypothetical protein